MIINPLPGELEDTCLHPYVYSDNGACANDECGMIMDSISWDAEIVRSAPNAAAGMCANGNDCDGGDGCTAVYIPDHARARDVVVGYKYTVTCAYCDEYELVPGMKITIPHAHVLIDRPEEATDGEDWEKFAAERSPDRVRNP